MRITDVRLVEDKGLAELSAELDGFRLWYRFPSEFAPAIPGDVFLSAALLVAMRENVPIEMETPCSAELLDAVRGPIQDIFAAWYSDLSRVNVHAEVADKVVARSSVASFFSGGVDGLYTFLKHQPEITHLVSVQGIDVQVDNDELWNLALRENQELAEIYGKSLIPMSTNIRHWCHPRGVGWSRFHGAGLASLAHVLGMRRCYVAATHTYAELFPWGSHPLTDPLWSSDSVSLIHDGAEASRSDKLRMIGQHTEPLRRLRVCWMDTSYNCGECEKCIRTRVGLRALGLATPTLTRLESVSPVRKLTIWDANELAFFEDNYRLASEAGDRELASALRSCLRRYHVRNAIADLDQYVLGGTLRRAKSLVRPQKNARK